MGAGEEGGEGGQDGGAQGGAVGGVFDYGAGEVSEVRSSIELDWGFYIWGGFPLPVNDGYERRHEPRGAGGGGEV